MSEETIYTFKEVWDTLSHIDVSKHIKKKNNLSYLSWTFAHQVMMENFPEYEYAFTGTEYHNDASATVHCTVRIGNLERTMFLPVMTGFTNAAVKDPTARDIGDSNMRCLVKAFAMFGLGHYIYAGEDLPSASSETAKKATTKAKTDPVAKKKVETAENSDEMHRATQETFSVFVKDAETIDNLASFWKDNIKVLKAMEEEAPERYASVLQAFKDKKAELSASNE